MPFYPKSEDLELLFVVDGDYIINRLNCAGQSYPQIQLNMDRFILNAKGETCKVILFNTKRNKEVRRLERIKNE